MSTLPTVAIGGFSTSLTVSGIGKKLAGNLTPSPSTRSGRLNPCHARARIKLAPTDPQTFNLNHGLIAQLQADIADLNQKMDRLEVCSNASIDDAAHSCVLQASSRFTTDAV
jgi:hypothetical protein